MVIVDIKNFLAKNVYLYEYAASLANYKKNNEIWSLIDSVSQIDSIKNFNDFEKMILKFKNRPKSDFMYALSSYAADSRMYGHI